MALESERASHSLRLVKLGGDEVNLMGKRVGTKLFCGFLVLVTYSWGKQRFICLGDILGGQYFGWSIVLKFVGALRFIVFFRSGLLRVSVFVWDLVGCEVWKSGKNHKIWRCQIWIKKTLILILIKSAPVLQCMWYVIRILMFVPWWVLYIPFGGSPDLFHRQSLLLDGDDFHDIQNTLNIDMASHRGFSRKQGCVLSALSAKLFRFSLKRRVNTKTAYWDERMQCCNYMIWHSRSTRNHLAHQGPFCLMANWLKIANAGEPQI